VSILDRLFHRHHLRDVHEPMELKLHGKLTSPNQVASPVSPLHAVLLRYELHRRTSVEQWDRSHAGDIVDAYDLAHRSRIFCGDDILIEIEGAIVRVPTETLEVIFLGGSRHPEPLLGATPPKLAKLVAKVGAAGEGEVCYREDYLLEGDPVELDAWIRPLRSAEGGPYRGEGAAYVVCEPNPVLRELEPSIEDTEETVKR
jgi:hypothetical protein